MECFTLSDYASCCVRHRGRMSTLACCSIYLSLHRQAMLIACTLDDNKKHLSADRMRNDLDVSCSLQGCLLVISERVHI